MTPLLKVSQLNTHYGKNIHAVKNVSFEVNEGEIAALIGSNGAGKSTTLLSISGLLSVDKGSLIEFAGTNITGKTPSEIVKLGITLVPEGREVFPGMTVNENLLLGAYSRTDRREISDSYERVYNLFPRLKEREKQAAGTLSGGEQQMLAIGRALMSQPKLMMLDEPSMGLAPNLVQMIFEMIKMVNIQGVTILLVEQNARMALNVAEHGFILETGSIIMKDRCENIKKNDMVRKAYLGL